MKCIADEKTAEESGLKDGSKVVLFCKRAADVEDNVAKEDFWSHFYKLLLRHFKKEDADKILSESQKVCIYILYRKTASNL